MVDKATNSAGSRNGDRRSKTMTARVSAVGTGVILVGFMVMTVSRAAFVATTDNVGNTASTGALTLTDNDTGDAMFTDFVLAEPGDTDVSCINVTYDGDFDPTEVKLYTAGTTGGIADHLDLKIEVGAPTATAFDDCGPFVPTSVIYDGTVGALDAANTSYATGISTTFDPLGVDPVVDTRTFRFTIEVAANPNGAGQNGTFGFVWETQSP